MPKVGTAYVSIRARLDKLDKDLKSGLSLTEKYSNKMANSVSNVFKAVASGYAFKMIFDGLKGVVDETSNLEEATSKASVVFRGQMDIVKQWSDVLVESYGMSRRESAQYLSSVQDLLVPMGMVPDAAARMSNEIVKLSADLGSFNNQPTSKVMEDIQSALVGNYETMKKYGVVLRESIVTQEVLNSGIAKSKAEITASDKAYAAYNIILRSSEAAVGDFARTSDGYANTTKRLDAAWKNLSSTIGVKFIAAATKAKAAAADLLNAMDNLAKGPSIDDQIAQAQKRLDSLLQTQDDKEKDLLRRKLAREERMQEQRERFVNRNKRVSDESIKALEIQENLYNKQFEMSPHEADVKRAKEELQYLKDIKSMQDLISHESKKIDLIDFGVTGKSVSEKKKYTEAELKEFQKGADKYVDMWRLANDDKYEILSRTYDYTELDDKQLTSTFDELIELSEHTADAMQDTFSDLFFDIMKMEFNDLEDYASAFSTSVLKIFADIFAQLTRASITGKGDGWGSLFSTIFSAGGDLDTGEVIDWPDTGGVLTEPIVGINKPGSLHGFGDTAEAVVPLDRLGVNNQSPAPVNLTANFNVQSIDSQDVERFFQRNGAALADAMIDRMSYNTGQRNVMRSVLE